MRVTALAAAAVVLAGAWAGPLPAWTGTSFTAHMLLHMTVVVVAAPLLALGLAGGRADPVRWAPRLCAAIPASAIELAVVWAWHVPALHHAARAHAAVFAGEQASFLVSGMLLWASVLGGTPPVRRANTVPALAALTLTLAHMTLLGVLISLSPRPLYQHGPALAVEALADQQRGGAVMLVMSAAAYVAGAVAAGRRLLAASGRVGAEGV